MRRVATVAVALGALPVAAAPAPAAARPLVRYERTGGFAGFHDTVTVSTHGAVKVARRTGVRERTLSHRRLRALRRAIAKARFDSLRRRYAPVTPVADGIVQTVRHAGRTVVVQTGGDPPARLRRLLDRLDRILT